MSRDGSIGNIINKSKNFTATRRLKYQSGRVVPVTVTHASVHYQTKVMRKGVQKTALELAHSNSSMGLSDYRIIEGTQ